MTHRSLRLLAALAACATATAAAAKVRTKELTYEQGGTPLKGFLAWDDAAKGKRPGVLVVHEWWGENEHARKQAERLAEAGYVGLAIDMYGNGKVATHPKDAQAFMQEATKDPAVLTARFDAGEALLKQQPQVDPDKIAAFGYCFGGGVALNMARAGKDLDAVVTFHGSLKPFGEPAAKGKVKPAILVQTGAADPMVTTEQVQAFVKEMKDAGANVKVVTYPGAKHSFTNPDADKAGVDGLAYDAKADRMSWEAAMQFLKRVFATS
jgi:dienelactone hydrolase